MNWKTMTIGAKTALGFSIVLGLLLIVSVIAFNGATSIVRNANDVISGNKLDGMLAQREVDHLNWAAQVNALLTDDKVTELHVETDHHECGFGQWYHSEERALLIERYPNLRPILDEIDEPHQRLHASAITIEEHFDQANAGLSQELVEIQLAILEWSNTVSRKLGEEADGIGRVRSVLPEHVEIGISSIQTIYEMSDLTEAQKKQRAIETIAAMKYGEDGYIWIQDLHPRMVMNPNVTKLNGTDISQITDSSGKRFWTEMSRVAEREGRGFVSYSLKRPGRSEPSPKISYVELFEPWGWVIGTGTYIDENNPHLVERARQFAAGEPFSLGVELDQKNCLLKAFCESDFGREMQAKVPAFKTFASDIEKPRLLMFSSSQKIQDFVQENKIDKAYEVYVNETMAAKDSINALFDQVLDAEAAADAGFRKASHIYGSETAPALREVQRLLNELRAEAKAHVMTDEAMLAAADKVKLSTAGLALFALVTGAVLAVVIARGISRVLSTIANEMDQGAQQVASAAGQVSTGSQALAEGASEQAASLEETSSSLEELSSMSTRNAENSNEANRLVVEAADLVSQASRTMGSLNTSMTEIAEASSETQKIVKTIDEIAFQTNILALNAAVEAARAGEAGAGFAVVADEVRNLAQRAAEAAKNTSDLIARSATKVQSGSGYVRDTDAAFKQVQESTTRIGELIQSIAQASKEQSTGIEQMNTAVNEMDKVTQQSAANSEESAAAAEELSAQAQLMKEQVDSLLALITKKRGKAAAPAAQHRPQQKRPGDVQPRSHNRLDSASAWQEQDEHTTLHR
ncbi:MAG: methyl-accepting chemotaxis protein [Verrucomicrobiota bacterium]